MFRGFDRGPRGFAFAFGGPHGMDDAGEWQPWVRGRRERSGRGPQYGPGFVPPFAPPMLWHMMRRFGFGPGMPPGGPRMFGRGDLKYALLELLQERPKHGYEMMKELEDRSGGFYSPSAGAIYPTLQLLEDRGWVTTQVMESKKVYAITDAGREALSEHLRRAESHGGPRGWGERHHGHGGPFGRQARPELRALRDESIEVARLMRAAVLASGGDPERLARLRAIVSRTHADLDAFLGQDRSQEQRGSATSEDGDGPVEHL